LFSRLYLLKEKPACWLTGETVKLQIILDAIEQVGGIYVVTADHGNAEDMVKRNKSGQPLLDKNGKLQILTSHTLEPVSSLNFFLSNHMGD
jgi:2,3-bisphosphoglycerate-independent phosphoglycerate mutase